MSLVDAFVGGGPTQQQISTQAVLRAGVATVLEVSLEGEPFVWQRADHDSAGSGDYTLGLKYRLYAPPEGSGGPLVAVKPFVKLPAARAPIGSERVHSTSAGCSTRWLAGESARFGVSEARWGLFPLGGSAG